MELLHQGPFSTMLYFRHRGWLTLQYMAEGLRREGLPPLLYFIQGGGTSEFPSVNRFLRRVDPTPSCSKWANDSSVVKSTLRPVILWNTFRDLFQWVVSH